MQKIGNITSTADENGEWTNGNVAAGTPPTILDAAWFNTVQRELAGVVMGAGLTLDPKNDAQVLAGLKSMFLQTGNNFSEILAAGSAAQSAARTSLALGTASQRDVGTGINQIPDMAAFNLNSINCFRLPTGHVVQVGGGVTVNGGFTQSYQVPFPNQCLALIGTVYGTTGQRLFVATNTSDRTAANMNVVDMNGSGVNVSVGYIAIGR